MAKGKEINDLTLKATPVGADEIEIQETSGGASKKTTLTAALGNVAPEIVLDLTPQLGGNLDVNGKEITGAIDIHSDDDVILELGDAAGVNKVSVRDSGGNEVSSLDSDGKVEGTHLHLTDTATAIGDHLAELTIDAAGIGDVHAIETHYTTGTLGAADDQVAHDVEFNDEDATGGCAHAISVSRTGGGSASVGGMKINAEVDVIDQDSGTFGNVESFLIIAVDKKAEANSATTGDLPYFLALNDTITIGSLAKFGAITFVIDTAASGGGIAPTFEYSTGAASFAAFTPIDNTNGWKQTGTVSWVVANLAGWVVDSNTEFTIRVKRTRVSMTTEPIGSQVQVASTSAFGWDKSADVSIRDLTASRQIMMTGGSISAPSLADSAEPTKKGIFFSGTGATSEIDFVQNAILRWKMKSNTFGESTGVGACLLAATPTATIPSVRPRADDNNTGIGWDGEDKPTMIAGGVQSMKWTTTATKVTGGALNGEFLNIKSATASAAFDSDGNTHTFTNLIPAGAYLLALTTRVTETIVGATSVDIGDGSTADLWGNNTGVSVDTTTDHTDYTTAAAVGTLYLSANNVVITAVGGAADFSDGTMRVTALYIDVTAPTQ